MVDDDDGFDTGYVRGQSILSLLFFVYDIFLFFLCLAFWSILPAHVSVL